MDVLNRSDFVLSNRITDFIKSFNSNFRDEFKFNNYFIDMIVLNGQYFILIILVNMKSILIG